MRAIAVVSFLAALSVAGCRYEAPLTTKHALPIDTSVLGVWETVPTEGEESEKAERMIILEYSPTEYLVHYPVEKEGFYFRGYPIEIGGVKCVQLQIIGTEAGHPKSDEKKLFEVVSYRPADGELEVRTLNSNLVDDHIATSDALAKAFRDHKNDEDLFTDPGRFRRIKP